METSFSKLTKYYMIAKINGSDKFFFADHAIRLIEEEIFPRFDWPSVSLLKEALQTYWNYGGRCTEEKLMKQICLSEISKSDNFMLQDCLQHINHLSWILDLLAVCHHDGTSDYRTGFILKPGRPKVDDDEMIIILRSGKVIVNPLPSFIVEGYRDCIHYPTVQKYLGHYDSDQLYDYFGFFARLHNACKVKTSRIQKSIDALRHSHLPIVWQSVNV